MLFRVWRSSARPLRTGPRNQRSTIAESIDGGICGPGARGHLAFLCRSSVESGPVGESVTKHTHIRFCTYPQTEPPPVFASSLVSVFARHHAQISTEDLPKGLTSNEVLALLSTDLTALGFTVETGRTRAGKVDRPVFYGENGQPSLRYQIDGFHPTWRCGIEIEAGRAWMGNAVYRDLIQASLMVDLEYLCLAVPRSYRYQSGGKTTVSTDYDNTREVAAAVYGHSRIRMPYRLLLVGY